MEGQLFAVDVHGQVVSFEEIVELGEMDATLPAKPEMQFLVFFYVPHQFDPLHVLVLSC